VYALSSSETVFYIIVTRYIFLSFHDCRVESIKMIVSVFFFFLGNIAMQYQHSGLCYHFYPLKKKMLPFLSRIAQFCCVFGLSCQLTLGSIFHYSLLCWGRTGKACELVSMPWIMIKKNIYFST
jgi:hypothetical protein